MSDTYTPADDLDLDGTFTVDGLSDDPNDDPNDDATGYDESDADADLTPEQPVAAAPGAAAGAPRNGMNRAAIRRVASKAQEVSETDERIVGIAAHLLGSGTGLADLTTAIMSAPRSVTAPVNDLNAIAESDPMEAGVNAAAMGRDRIKAVWNLLAALGSGSTAPMPTANAKAAIAVAKAVFALDDSAKSDLSAVSALLRKN